MNLLKRFSALVRHYVSPGFVTLFCASFVLWYIVKLDHTYTTEYAVHVNIDGERLRVPCVVEGKGATLFGYRVYMHRQIRIPLSELKYTADGRCGADGGRDIMYTRPAVVAECHIGAHKRYKGYFDRQHSAAAYARSCSGGRHRENG